MKRMLPLALAVFFGWVAVALYFIPHHAAHNINEFLLDWIQIVGVFALLLGTWSLIRVNVDKIRFKRNDWPYSFLALFGLLAMVIFGLKFGGENSAFKGQESYYFQRLFTNVLIPIQSTTFSLLAFFIASAAYRAFRARSALATVLLVAALVVMLRFNPWIGETLRPLSEWVMNVPNLAAKRAIWMGVGLGIVATAMKVILGIERTYLGRD